jgi:nucleoside-diphosphate-sugar epimerase
MNLVTGGTGLVGMHLISALLKKGEPVRVMHRANSNLVPVKTFLRHALKSEMQPEWIVGELSDVGAIEDAMQGAHTVFHAAALVSFHPKDRNTLYDVNVHGTANMVNLALAEGVQKFVYISSVASLGRKDELEPVDETTEWKDGPELTHYSRSKHMAEREVWRGHEEGLDVVIVNPGVILGIGDFTRSSAEVFLQLDKGMSFFPPGANGFVAVEDVVDVCLHLLENGPLNERFLLVGAHMSLEELFQKVAKSIGKEAPTKAASPFLMGLVWRLSRIVEFFTRKRGFVTKEGVRNAQKKYAYDTSKLLNETSFKYREIDEVITETGAYYLAQKSK